MLRVSIVGCGKIADQHAEAISRIPECRVVSVCDQELLMAHQLAERVGGLDCFDDLTELLKKSSPDVVHITTPPQSHYLVAKQCIESGCHVYIEKPFTVTVEEAEMVLRLAEAAGVKITAGHNYQFTPEMVQMRQLVREGFLGGRPVHLESYYCYDVEDGTYFRPLLNNAGHWVRKLPGQLFHNVISHGIARLAEFLDNGLLEITASAHQSEKLRALGEREVLDELRVMIRDQNETTAFFSFSTKIKPGLSQFRICGPQNSILVDQVSGSFIRNEKRTYKSYLTFFVPPLVAAQEYLLNSRRNVLNFVRRRLYHDSGMTELIGRFYRHLVCGEPAPIPHREILLTARIMDEIFRQIYAQEPIRRVNPVQMERSLV